MSTQRMRENTIELTGVPDSVQDEFLESKFIEMMDHIGVKLRENEIQGIHRLPQRCGSTCKPVIAKFINRKMAEEIMFQKKRFNTVNFEHLGFPNDTKIYANLSLSPAFKSLDYHCRKLKKDKIIAESIASRQMIKIKMLDSTYKRIIHINDLRELFPDRVFN